MKLWRSTYPSPKTLAILCLGPTATVLVGASGRRAGSKLMILATSGCSCAMLASTEFRSIN